MVSFYFEYLHFQQIKEFFFFKFFIVTNDELFKISLLKEKNIEYQTLFFFFFNLYLYLFWMHLLFKSKGAGLRISG